MSDRFRRLVDHRAGPGGARNRCGCCGTSKKDVRSVRQKFKRELRKEIDEYYGRGSEIPDIPKAAHGEG